MTNSPSLAPAVYLIGAGPGDPELLTVKAHRLIQQADVILYANSLVPVQILEDTKPEAEFIATGSQTLEQIVPTMIARVKAGLSVVRLHSGDLTLYSAIQEQIQLLKAAGIPFELVPGISAFQAAAADLATELTIPKLVQTIILTRIGGEASPMPPTEELAALAAHQSSLCLYLAARHVDRAQAELLVHYAPDTPVAICYRVGWPDQQYWLTTLNSMAEVSQEQKLIRTTLYLISPALGLEQTERSQLYHPNHRHLFRR
ncbi:MAG: precorrin-4 C(11)-methyltransferase [Synechococcaceae cyanobacterium RL_1_2]|nr:precorrin-4 C(11)-methyltransferase [Synechococcaceae cyanobacterium RL_1_2]